MLSLEPGPLVFRQRHVNFIAELKSNHLARQDFRTRTQLNKLNLTFAVVQNFRKRVVHEFELRLVEPKRDGELQFFGRSRLDERAMKLAIVIQVRRITINRLLEIADHREMAWPRSLTSILFAAGHTRS